MYLVYKVTEERDYPGYGRYPTGGAPNGIGEPSPGSETYTPHLIGLSDKNSAAGAIKEMGSSPGKYLAVEANVVELSLRSY
jgi:hypothetical protein